MNLPKELSETLINAKESIENHQKGELILQVRKKIWTLFGEFKIGEKYRALITVGLKRRIKLSILCINKVIDEWNRVLPEDNSINIMINMIESYLNGETDGDVLRLYIQDNSTRLENLGYNNEKLQIASSIGFISIKAMGRTLSDEELIIYNNENAVDLDYDCYGLDVAYYSGVIYAGGGPWDANSSIEKRREFWLWYINEAVPQAYLAYKD